MLKTALKKILPRRLQQPSRKLLWWLRFLSAFFTWHFQYRVRGLRFQVLDLWQRIFPPDLGGVAFKEGERPRVSIVIPVHNQYRFTARCLRSIAAAEVKTAFEVIIVDDRSTDGTPESVGSVDGLRVIANDGERGFVHATNRGAREARGEFVLFLNNDTTVESGWLDRLTETFDLFPQAGAVGAQLVFADGRLQEAGGIVWRDGSAWNYGRFMHPDTPRFAYARRVDYCSGACLMVRRELFERLGGFNLRYAPGYYEDADLAFQIRASGYEVVYQSQVRVHHYEGATAGRSLSEGMKRWQVEHREQFVERWRETLQQHRPNGVEPELAKERGCEKRALIIEPRMIRPDRDAGSLRMFNWMAVLQQEGFKLTFLPANMIRAEPYSGLLQSRGVEVQYTPFVTTVEAHLRESGSLYDYVIVGRLEAAKRYLDAVRRHCPRAVLIFDTVDLHFVRELREADHLGRPELRQTALDTRRDELCAAREADVTVVVSEEERRLLLNEAPDANVHVVSTIHQQYPASAEAGERRDLLFVGGFEHPPNIDAVEWMVNDVLPHVLKRLPDCRLYVIGSDPPTRIRALESDRVVATGYVEDIRPYWDRCRLSVAPLRYGAGVKGKINQSMAHGVPVVATPIACEGMFLENGRDVLIAESAEAFAEAVCRLYEDDDLWNLLARGGRENVERYHSFAAARAATRRLIELSLPT